MTIPPRTLMPRQRELARHALGLNRRRKMSYRNYFYADRGSPDCDEWAAMYASGLAFMRIPKDDETGGLVAFWLTRQGAELALDKGEKLCPEDFPNER